VPADQFQLLRSELVDGHPDIVEDAPQRAFGHVTAAMNRYGGAAPVRVAQDVVATR